MQSSTVLAIRALIMLGFLIAVPLVAIFGTSLPEVVQAVIDGHLATRAQAATPDTSSSSAASAAAPPFQGTASSASAPAFSPASSAAPLQTDAAITSASPVFRENPFGPPSSASSSLPAMPSQNPFAARSLSEPAMNPEVQPGPMSPSQPAPSANPAEQALVPVASQADQMVKQLERRLQELGASYYRLESWGGEQPMYRFSCAMPIQPGLAFSQHFQASLPSAEDAMANVVGQIEQWRSNGSQVARTAMLP